MAAAGAAVCYYVIEAILSKLPLKSLLRFSCASKTWYSIISDPKFCKMIMRPGVLIYNDCRDLSTITLESLLATALPTPLSFPWEVRDRSYQYRCLGSCNGLVCMYRRDSFWVDWSFLIVCNPLTRKFKKLPHPRLHYDWWTFVGFGYDESESVDDYKLVWIDFRDVSLDVFTLKSNTWRTQKLDNHFAVELRNISTDGGVLCNKKMHWIADCSRAASRRERCILVLDLATEKFRVFSFSHSRLEKDDRAAWIGSLDGECLWLCDHVQDGGVSVSNLWVMKEYGVVSSWTKQLSIRGYAPIRFPIRFSMEKEGKEMEVICMVTSKPPRIVKLRVEEEEVKQEEILLLPPYTSSVILHMESLVPIN